MITIQKHQGAIVRRYNDDQIIEEIIIQPSLEINFSLEIPSLINLLA